jgi:hypothetical protein
MGTLSLSTPASPAPTGTCRQGGWPGRLSRCAIAVADRRKSNESFLFRGNPSIGRRTARRDIAASTATVPPTSGGGLSLPVLQIFSDGRQKQCRSENNQACPVRCHSAWSRIRAVNVLIVLRQPDRRAVSDQNRLQITPSAGPLSTLKKSMDTHSNRCLVIYRPPGPAACRHQLAGDRPGLFRGQEDRDERDLRSVDHTADGIASQRVRSEVLPLHLFRGYA